jgi:endonuclease YncB( thermonuclease family)
MDNLPFALLAAALLAFLVSTRQIALAWRIPIWLVGAALLGAAVWLSFRAPEALGFLQTAIHDPHAFIDALRGNWGTVGLALAPMLDILCLATGLVALACLVALTPGEAVEKAVRPFNIALIGAVAGALLALGITGVGFGGLVKRQVYLGVVSAGDIIDGDTIRMGDVSLRLWGIDAPEKEQPCSPPNAEPCGQLSKKHLTDLTGGAFLVCRKRRGDEGAPQETLGRPIVICERRSDRLNLNKQMVVAGCADVFRDHGKVKSDYEPYLPAAGAPRICPPFSSPETWRRQT